VPAFASGVAAHLLMDVTPHYDPESDLGYVLDAAAGVTALAAIAAGRFMRKSDPLRAALFGALGCGLPDVELLIKVVYRDFPPERYLMPWHNGTIGHGETRPLASTLSQTALWVLMLGLVARKVRRASGTAGRAG
jgi:hypothetical protein